MAGTPEDVIHGMVYEVRERDSLITYETDSYRLEPCTIGLESGVVIEGRTFVWCEDLDGPRDGVFDLKDWLLGQKGL